MQPSNYHHKLAKLDNFESYKIDQIPQVTKRLCAILKDQNSALQTQSDDVIFNESQTLPAIIEKFYLPQIKDCPLCHSKNFSAISREENRSFFKCRECGSIFQKLFSKTDERYSENYFFDEYEAQYGKSYIDDFDSIFKISLKRCHQISKMLPKKLNESDVTLLDIGAAYGHFLSATKVFGFKGSAIEIASSAVKFMKQKGFEAAQLNFESTEESELNIEKKDVITCWYVLEHFADLKKAIQKVTTLLNDGGIFAFSMPNASGISGKKNMSKFLSTSPADHHIIVSPRVMKKELAKFGFHSFKIKCRSLHPERILTFKNRDLANSKIIKSILTLVGKLFCLGDTFECYCKWGSKK